MKELLEKYPKAAKVVHAYYLEKLLNSLNDRGLDEEFKEHVREQGLPIEQIVSLMEVNPIALVDVFTEHNIFITIIFHKEKVVPKLFELVGLLTYDYYIYCPKLSNLEETGDMKRINRKDAEQDGIEAAFKLLESEL